MKTTTTLLILSLFFFQCIHAQTFSVKEYGAKADGISLDTRAIQAAIDAANANGGGVVDVPAGRYKIGTLFLKDNVDLHLNIGAVLEGSADINDYTIVTQKQKTRTSEYANRFMLFAEDVKNISITGKGTIDGNGENFKYINHRVTPMQLRPTMVRLVNCDNILIEDVLFFETACWNIHLLGCSNVKVDRITVKNTQLGNRDGIDIDACKDVFISNSKFETIDDAVCLKSTFDRLSERITITNCIITSHASAIKFGTESNGGFRDVVVSNCIIKNIPYQSGIDLITVDGGIIENISFNNIIMDSVAQPIMVKMGSRARRYAHGKNTQQFRGVHNVSFSNIKATNVQRPSMFLGLNSISLENISVSNYYAHYNSSEKKNIPSPNKVNTREFDYPMSVSYRGMPAFGFYCKNVNGLYFDRILIDGANGEARPAFMFDQTQDVDLCNVKVNVPNYDAPLLYVRNSSNVVAQRCETLTSGNTDVLVMEEGTVEDVTIFNCVNNVPTVITRLLDEKPFYDFKANQTYSVSSSDMVGGLNAVQLSSEKPYIVEMDMPANSVSQLVFLVSTPSQEPQKIKIKYGDIEQYFQVDWSRWGWAPITLNKDFKRDEKVKFEITSSLDTPLYLSKVYLRSEKSTILD